MGSGDSAVSTARDVVAQPPSRAEAFEHFKVHEEEGAELEVRLAEHKAALREKKRLSRDLTEEANAAQAEIDRLRSVVDAKAHARAEEAEPVGPGGDPDEVIIDEEEYIAIRALKDAKRLYRDRYDRVRTLRAECAHSAQVVEATREALLVAFDSWYAESYGVVSPELALRRSLATSASATAAEAAAAHRGAALDSDGDELDDAERFERMERKRLEKTDPDATAFYNARRTTKASAVRAGTARRGTLQAKRDRRVAKPT
jgi:hypothetical protein